MSHLLLFLFAFIAASQTLAFVISIVARFWVLRMEPMTLRGTDVESATHLVAVYVESVHDHGFAFPTGVFRADPAETRAGHVCATEANFKGSAGLGLIKFGLAIPAIGFSIGAEEGAGAALLGLFIGGMIAAFLICPILFVATVDIVLRFLMKSRIEADIVKHPQHDDAVLVTFALRGLSAFGVERALRRGMTSPQLPARLAPAGAAVAALAPPAPRSRLNLIYGCGALAAAVVALVVVAVNPGSGGRYDASATADSSSYQTSSPSSSYEGDTTTDDGSSDGYDDGSTDESSDGYDPSGTTDEVTPEDSGTPTTATLTPEAAMQRAVRKHWLYRESGSGEDLHHAWGLYGPPLRRRAGGDEDAWTEAIAADGLTSADVTYDVAQLDDGDDTGSVEAHVTTEASSSGCHRWNFTYTMRRVNGRWLLWDQTLNSKHNC